VDGSVASLTPSAGEWGRRADPLQPQTVDTNGPYRKDGQTEYLAKLCPHPPPCGGGGGGCQRSQAIFLTSQSYCGRRADPLQPQTVYSNVGVPYRAHGSFHWLAVLATPVPPPPSLPRRQIAVGVCHCILLFSPTILVRVLYDSCRQWNRGRYLNRYNLKTPPAKIIGPPSDGGEAERDAAAEAPRGLRHVDVAARPARPRLGGGGRGATS